MGFKANMSFRKNMEGKRWRQANKWVMLLHSEVADREVFAKFDAWLKAHPHNASVYANAEQLWRDLDGVEEIATFDVEQAIANLQSHSIARSGVAHEKLQMVFRTPSPAPRKFLGRLAAAVAIVFVPAIFFAGNTLVANKTMPDLNPYIVAGRIAPSQELVPLIVTEVGEIRDVTLADGTIVSMGAKSQIRTKFTLQDRRVILVAGEAFFDVVKDENRPFFVEADDALIRVVGTQFDVKRNNERVTVAVLEGVVNVFLGDGNQKPFKSVSVDEPTGDDGRQVLVAGEKIVIEDKAGQSGLALRVEKTNVLPGIWRKGRLVYENAPLSEVIADANRYYDKTILLSSDSLGNLSVVGSFRAGQIDQMLAGLALSQPVRIDRSHADQVVITPLK